jgi:hypothetical protein
LLLLQGGAGIVDIPEGGDDGLGAKPEAMKEPRVLRLRLGGDVVNRAGATLEPV